MYICIYTLRALNLLNCSYVLAMRKGCFIQENFHGYNYIIDHKEIYC